MIDAGTKVAHGVGQDLGHSGAVRINGSVEMGEAGLDRSRIQGSGRQDGGGVACGRGTRRGRRGSRSHRRLQHGPEGRLRSEGRLLSLLVSRHFLLVVGDIDIDIETAVLALHGNGNGRAGRRPLGTFSGGTFG